MNSYHRKLFRDLVQQKVQVLAVALVIAMGVITFSGILIGQVNLQNSVDLIYQRTHFEDFSVSLRGAPTGTVRELREIPGVTAAEERLVGEVLLHLPGDRTLTARMIGVHPGQRPTVDDVIVEEGHYFDSDPGFVCLVEQRMATNFDLDEGDVVRVRTGEGEVALEVVGSVISPEYLRLVRSRQDPVSSPRHFGVLFVPLKVAQEILGRPDEVNNMVARVKDATRVEEIMGDAEEVLSPYGVIGLTERDRQPSYYLEKLDLNSLRKLAIFFSLLLLFVAALSIYIMMTRLVYSQEREIGVSRALGYSSRRIMTHYLGYSAIIGVGGSVLGLVGGYFLAQAYVAVYTGVLELPLAARGMHWGVALVGIGVSIIVCALGGLLPAHSAVKLAPAEAIRVEAEISLTPIKHHHLPRLLSRMGFPAWARLSLRNLGRNPRRTLLACLGVMMTVGLLVVSVGSEDSMNHAVSKHVNEVVKWDLAVGYSEPVTPEMLERVRGIEGVEKAQPELGFPARIDFDDWSDDFEVIGVSGSNDMHGFFPTPGSSVPPGPGGVVLNRGLESHKGIKLGDSVRLVTEYGEIALEVEGFTVEPCGGIAYVNRGYLQELAGMGDVFNVITIRARPGAEGRIANILRENPEVKELLVKSQIYGVVTDLVRAIDYFFIIMYVIAFVMGFSVLFTLVTINLLERRREIATMRTMGAGMWEVFGTVTLETLTVGFLALGPGLALGWVLCWLMVEKVLGTATLAPEVMINWQTYIYILVGALVVMVVSEIPGIRQLLRMDLARVTKERAD